MALQELGIATDIVTTAFAILFGAIALALALSFGLGNRDLAGEITREWYEQYRANARKRWRASSRKRRSPKRSSTRRRTTHAPGRRDGAPPFGSAPTTNGMSGAARVGCADFVALQVSDIAMLDRSASRLRFACVRV